MVTRHISAGIKTSNRIQSRRDDIYPIFTHRTIYCAVLTDSYYGCCNSGTDVPGYIITS